MNGYAIEVIEGALLSLMGALMVWQPGHLVRDFTVRRVVFGKPLSERATGLMLRYALGPIMFLSGVAALYMAWYTSH